MNKRQSSENLSNRSPQPNSPHQKSRKGWTALWVLGVMAILITLFSYAYRENLLDKWIPKTLFAKNHLVTIEENEPQEIIGNDPTNEMTVRALRHELAETHHQLQEYKSNLFSLNHPKDKEKINELEHSLIIKEKQNLELMSMLKHIERELNLKNSKLSNTETITEALAAMIKTKNNAYEQISKNLQEEVDALIRENLSFAELVDGYDVLYKEMALRLPYSQAEEILITELILKNTFDELLNLFEPVNLTYYLHDLIVYDDLVAMFDETQQINEDAMLSLHLYVTTRLEENARTIDQLQTELLNEMSLNEALLSLSNDENQDKHFTESAWTETYALIAYLENELSNKEQQIKKETEISDKLYQTTQQFNDDLDYLNLELFLVTQKYQNEQEMAINLTQQIAKLSQVVKENGKVNAENKQMKMELDQLTQAIVEGEYLHIANAMLTQKLDSYTQVAEENQKILAANEQLEKQIEQLTLIIKDNSETLASNDIWQRQAEQISQAQNESQELQASNLLLLNEVQSLVRINEKTEQDLAENNQWQMLVDQLVQAVNENNQLQLANVSLIDEEPYFAKLSQDNEQLQLTNERLQTQIQQLALMIQENDQNTTLSTQWQTQVEQLIEAMNDNEQLQIANVSLLNEIQYLAQLNKDNKQLQISNERLQKQTEQLALMLQENDQNADLNNQWQIQVAQLIQAVHENEQLQLTKEGQSLTQLTEDNEHLQITNERLQKQTEQLALMLQENDQSSALNNQWQIQVEQLIQAVNDNEQLRMTNARLQKQTKQLTLMIQENDQSAFLNNQWQIQVEQLIQAVNESEQLQQTNVSLLKEIQQLAQINNENAQLHTTNNLLNNQIEQLVHANEYPHHAIEEPSLKPQETITQLTAFPIEENIAKIVPEADRNEQLRFANPVVNQVEPLSLNPSPDTIEDIKPSPELEIIYQAFLEDLSQTLDTKNAAKSNTSPLKKTFSPASRFTRIAQFKNKKNDTKLNTPDPTLRTHLVLEGENLQDIANIYYGSPDSCEMIYEANQSQIQDKMHLTPGILLVIPEIK